MADSDVLRLNAELSLQLADYWHEIDTNGGRNASAYYTEDAEFHGQFASYIGRDKIQPVETQEDDGAEERRALVPISERVIAADPKCIVSSKPRKVDVGFVRKGVTQGGQVLGDSRAMKVRIRAYVSADHGHVPARLSHTA